MTLTLQSSPIKAYSMLNPRKRHSLLFPNIKNLNNLPKFRSFSKKYDDDINLNENKDNDQNDDFSTVKSQFIGKIYTSVPDLKNEICYLNDLLINSNTKKESGLSSLPSLPSPKSPKFNQVFKEKIKVCEMLFNSSQIKVKSEKSKALIEINALLLKKNEIKLLTSENKDLLLEMIAINIFDQNPFSSPEFISTFFEHSWENINLIYKILNQFLAAFPEKCNISHVKKCIRLLNSSNDIQKDNLVNFLINYTKVHYEQFNDILKLFKSALINVIYGIYEPYCVDSIISFLTDFFIPNRINYLSQILCTHLLPLFKHEKLSIYFEKLNNFILQIVHNNVKDQLKVIKYLIKYFPHQCGQKQPLFALVINSAIIDIDEQNLNSISTELFNFIVMSIRSPNSKLTELALCLLMQQNMKLLVIANYEYAKNILYGPLKWASTFYWDKPIKEQSQAVILQLLKAQSDFHTNKAYNNFFQSPQSQKNWSCEQIKQNSNICSIENSAKTWASLITIASKRYKASNLEKSILKIKMEFSREVLNKDFKKIQESLL